MFHRWKDYFSFSKAERRGMYVLMGLLFIFTAGRYWVANYYQPHNIELDRETNFQIQQFIAENQTEKEEINTAAEKSVQQYHFFKFNPNEAGREELTELGFSSRVVNNIMSYREAGGYFSKAEDILRIYHFPDSIFPELKSYIHIPDPDFREVEDIASESQEQPAYFNKIDEDELSKQRNVIVELNLADSTDLIQVFGIGPFRASSIIERRNALGGFYTLTQLNEIYSIDDSVLIQLKPQFEIDTSLIRRININEADFTTLVRHPYIDRNLANLLIRYRKQHGYYPAVEEIQNLHLVNDELYRKIAPYFTVK